MVLITIQNRLKRKSSNNSIIPGNENNIIPSTLRRLMRTAMNK